MRPLIVLPLLIVLVVFALSNTQAVTVGLWPTGYRMTVPLSAAMLVSMAAAFLLGALIVWMAELGQRIRARRAERTVRLLEEQVQELKARLRPSALPPAA